jgi:outer membrane protein
MLKFRPMSRLALVLLCGGILLAGVAAQESTATVTLAQSIESALAQGDDMRVLQGTLQIARAQNSVDKARAGLLLSANGGYNHIEDISPIVSSLSSLSRAVNPSQGSTEGVQAGLTLSGPVTTVTATAYPYVPESDIINSSGDKTGTNPATAAFGVAVNQILWNGYPGGAARAAVDKSGLTLQGKELAADSGKLTLVYKVKQAYFTVLSAQRTLAVRRENFARQQALVEQLSAAYTLQQATAVDLAAARINAQSAGIDVRAGEHDFRIARIRLANLAGWAPEREYAVAETDDPPVPDIALVAAVADGLSRRPELKQLELNREAADIDLTLARGQALPTVSISGGLDWAYRVTDAPLHGTALTAGVKVGMPLLDAGAARGALELARQQQGVYQVQAGQLRRTISTDIQDAYEAMLLQKDRLEVARLSAQNLETQFELTRTKVQFGTGTNQDLLDASINLANARVAASKARSDLQLAVLLLQSVMGY